MGRGNTRAWSRHGAAVLAACVVALIACLPASAHAAKLTRYSVVGGCYGLRSVPLDRLLARDPGGGYRASAAGLAGAELFRMQATDLGEYLLYGERRDFLATRSPLLGIGDETEVAPAARPSASAVWRVEEADGGSFRLVSTKTGKALSVSRPRGDVGLAAPAGAGPGSRFRFEEATGCPRYPEVQVNATGKPSTGETPYGEVRGLIDAHMHMMAFEFLGGRAHCGRPWHRFGAPYALRDCLDHEVGHGCAAVLENVLFGNPARCHDPVGWPTFKDWPHHASLTHEQSYYKWLERAWRGGLRVFVNLLVENHALCTIYPLKKNSCNEMDSVRLQARRIRQLQDYIDAQSGGPGKGWFRIVENPFEARRVINRGKLAVVLGIEVSQPFDCTVRNEVPGCDRRKIDRQLDEVRRLGVRDMELINKFDNALGGVAGDAGTTGIVVNAGNFFETGKFWQMQTCEGEGEDNPQLTIHNDDNLIANGFEALLPPGATPVYPEPPHCNTRGLTALGEYAIRRLMDKRMIIDPDHLDVISRVQALNLIEANRYSGVVSSHSWSSSDAYPRVYRAGGVVTPYAGDSTGFVEAWRALRPLHRKRYYFGFGYGADMNGFGAQGGPREPTAEAPPVHYPFKSFDGAVTLDRQRSGQRLFDINEDGVAHYGLYPDWIEDLRMIAGKRIIRDMSRGPEAYLQMWERAVGVPATHCRSGHATLGPEGFDRIRLGYPPERLLRRAGQPDRRTRTWRYCVKGPGNRRASVTATFTRGGRVGLVASSARGHGAGGIHPGDPVDRLLDDTTAFGNGVRVGAPAPAGSRFVYGVRDGRVSFVAVASSAVARSRVTLRRGLAIAGVR